MENKKQFKVLSINGGGMRGVIATHYLAQIEEITGKPIHQLFDLIIGTSTGGILACGVGANIRSIKEIQTLYRTEGRNIFKKNILSLITSKYQIKGLRDTMNKYFESFKMRDCLTKVIVTARDVLGNENMIIKSYGHYEDMYIKDAVSATSAAPRYFPPYPIDYNNKRYITWDGGVYANNPSLIAQAEANKLGYSDDEILMVTIGTGKSKSKQNDITNPNLLKLIDILIPQMLDSQTELVEYVNQLSIKNYYNFNLEIPKEIADMDKYEFVPQWEELAKKQVKLDNSRIEELCLKLI